MTHSKQFEEYLASILPEPSEEEILRRWWGAREAVAWQAIYAAQLSQSYRPFPVGCAVRAYKKGVGPDVRWRIFRGANIKVVKEAPKICAEMTAVMAAMQAGYDRIVGMVVVGNPREEDATPFLHPCETCREAFKTLPVIRPDTQLMLVRPEGDAYLYEEMSVGELLAYHASGRAGS